MISEENILEQITESVTRQVVDGMRDAITKTVERELASSLSKALIEGEFYRKLNDEMREGLQNIYREISTATKTEGGVQTAPPASQSEADKLFTEASRQLDEIFTTTKEATDKIMDIVEQQQDLQIKSTALLENLRNGGNGDTAEKLTEINDKLGNDLIEIMTTLSFQDLTGQRIQRIIKALVSIETIVFDMYMSTGLILKAREEDPERDIEELRAETKQKVSELKGPQTDASQDDVDDLLSQLGLE